MQTLQNITKGLRARWDQDLRASIPGMNASRAHLMVHLAQEGAIPQVRLARLAGFSEMTLTRLLDELERASWVVREPTPIDRRVHAIRLTIDGRRTLTAIHLNSREFIRRNLGATDEEHVGGLIAALAALK